MQIKQNGRRGGPGIEKHNHLTLAQRFRLAEYLKANAEQLGGIGRHAIAAIAGRSLGFDVAVSNVATIVRELEIDIRPKPGGGSRFIASASTVRTMLRSIASLRAEIGAQPDPALDEILAGMPADD